MYIFQKNILIVKPLEMLFLGFYILLIEEKKIVFAVLGPNCLSTMISQQAPGTETFLFWVRVS